MHLKNISSANRRLLRNYPSIITSLFSQFNLRNCPSIVDVKSMGEMVSLCLTPLSIMIFSLSLCKCTVTELSVYMSFRNYMYTSYMPCSCNGVTGITCLLHQCHHMSPPIVLSPVFSVSVITCLLHECYHMSSP